MIDLHDIKRKISLIFARHRAKSLARCLCAVSRLHHLALIHRIYAPLNGPACRRLKPTFATGNPDLRHHPRQAGALTPQVISAEMFIDDGLDFTGYDRCARASAALVRCQGAGSPTILGEPPYPAPDCRPADPELPNRIADAAFQTAFASELCLNKRTQDRRPARSLNAFRSGLVPFPLHRSQLYAPVNSVSRLEANISDLEAKYQV